jgi:hypothetical protein
MTDPFARLVTASPEYVGYGRDRIPSPRDEFVKSLVLTFNTLSDGEKQAAAASMNPSGASILRAFAERMANLTLRTGDLETAQLGLVAVAVVEGVEPKEALLILPLLFEAIARSGGDPIAEFDAAAEKLGIEGGAQFLKSFSSRSPRDQRMEAMGYELADTGDGPSFVRQW